MSENAKDGTVECPFCRSEISEDASLCPRC